MLYINNNNSRNEECSFVPETNLTNQYYQPRYLISPPNDVLSVNDYDFGNLKKMADAPILKSNHRESFADHNYIPNYEQTRKASSECNKWLSSHDNQRQLNSTHPSILNPSDDEALEHYLNDLAKNYDDIDRRIRNAEKFVNQIEEAQNPNVQIGQQNSMKVKNHCTSFNRNDDLESINKVKYITELRVNIAENLSNDNLFNGKDNVSNLSFNDNRSVRSNLPKSNVVDYITPSVRKTSTVSTTPLMSEPTPSLRSHMTNFCSHINMANVYRESNSPKSKSSSHSISNQIDFEQISLPPPSSFNPSRKPENRNQEVQTMDDMYNYRNNFTTTLEERSVQTMSPVSCVIRATVDTGVGTESKYQRTPKIRATPIRTPKLQSVPQPVSAASYESDCSSTSDRISGPGYGGRCSSNLDSRSSVTTCKRATAPPQLLPQATPQTAGVSVNKKRTPRRPRKQMQHKAATSSGDRTSDDSTSSHMAPPPQLQPTATGTTKTRTAGLKTAAKHVLRPAASSAIARSHKKIIDDPKMDSTQNASFEIQRLLENLGSHLQATMSMREPKSSTVLKTPISTENSSSTSFWDNPLHKNDLMTSISNKKPASMASSATAITTTMAAATTATSLPRLRASNTTVKATAKTSLVRGVKKKSVSGSSGVGGGGTNTINSELRAICQTMEKGRKFEEESLRMLRETVDSRNNCDDDYEVDNEDEYDEDDDTDKGGYRNRLRLHNHHHHHLHHQGDIMTAATATVAPNSMMMMMNGAGGGAGGGGTGSSGKKSNSTLNLSTNTSAAMASNLVRFPGNYKVTRTFELSPYDDLIKSHLSPCDRRVKSVAAKNGCRIAIEGPINVYDPASCQAFRNKVTYRCTIASQSKENLDKCMNYLKETFPNTFLRINQRSG